MKTAMQLAIEHYEKLSLQGSNQAYVVADFLKKNFLEMEKQQIIEASNESYLNSELLSRTCKNKKVHSIGEQYYNETFKQ